MIHRALNWLKRRRQTAEQARLQAGGPALKVLLFHGIYDEAAGPCPDDVDPSLVVSLGWVERCLAETQQQGFRFIHPEELPNALLSSERLALLTLDDGYANNLLLLPLLNRLQVPALLFVTTDNLLRSRSYWWDVLARNSADAAQLSKKRRELKKLRPKEIEQNLMQELGEHCFAPRGDHDRPMTPEELREFARQPLIGIGNHTHHHTLLDQCQPDEALDELSRCGLALEKLLGSRPTTLAYPNGRWNQATERAAKLAGITTAFTTERLLAPLPLRSSRHLSIPRLQPLPASS